MVHKKSFFQTSIGKKLLMSFTGILLLGFVILHMLGHLQMFKGQDAYNSYAVFLKNLGPILWLARIGLFLIFIIHIFTAVNLNLKNKSARPVRYSFKKTIRATFASKTMVYSGLLILCFLIYHLLHFTLGVTHPDQFKMVDTEGRHDVYTMMILSFKDIKISIVYILSIFILFLHLKHGISSSFQTLGINYPNFEKKIRLLAIGLSLFIFLGYISVPVAILLDIIKLP